MKTIAQALDLQDDPALIAEYIAWHEQVWPEVLEALRAIGIHDMKIFLHATRLFMVAQVPDDFDPAAAYQAYAASGRAAEWDEKMRAYQQRVPGAPDGAWWTPMALVFDLNVQLEANRGR